jgi:D-amino peptidase
MSSRVFISVDMEGVAGVATLDQILRGGYGYPRAQELMTAEANAAICGAFAAGAGEVVVNDSHGTMDNLLAAALDPRARLVIGAPKPSCMVQGISRDVDVALFIGYHAAASDIGVLAHTFSSNFTELRVNGQPVSEAEVNALFAAHVGVPIGLVTGDDQICGVAEKAFAGVRTVAVKTPHGFAAGESIHPTAACDLIEQAAAEAVREAASLRPLTLPDAFVVEVEVASQLGADYAANVPRCERVNAHTVRCHAADARELMAVITSWYYLVGLAAQQFSQIANRR